MFSKQKPVKKDPSKKETTLAAGALALAAGTLIAVSGHISDKGQFAAEGVQRSVDNGTHSTKEIMADLVPSKERRAEIDSLLCHEIVSKMSPKALSFSAVDPGYRKTSEFGSVLTEMDRQMSQDAGQAEPLRESLYKAALVNGYKRAYDALPHFTQRRAFVEDVQEKARAVEARSDTLSTGNTIFLHGLMPKKHR